MIYMPLKQGGGGGGGREKEREVDDSWLTEFQRFEVNETRARFNISISLLSHTTFVG